MTADFVVVGAGIVGLTIARELKAREPKAKVVILEKEDRPGRHASGRNSGVLHSGIYYASGSLKARICGQGAREMARYCEDRGLPLRRIGKVLLPDSPQDTRLLDVLAGRAVANGVEAHRLTAAELKRVEPEAAPGEALLVPGTSVIDPLAVMCRLAQEARAAGIDLKCGSALGEVNVDARTIEWSGEQLAYGHLVNAAGLHADRIAHRFGVAERFALLPFRGRYWKVDPRAGIRLNHLLYPVPDLRVPFLGIHTTSAIDGSLYLGPSAIPALGRENYRGLEGAGPSEAFRIAWLVGRLFAGGRDGFRTLARREAGRLSRSGFTAAARALLPRLRSEHLLACDKTGLRAQLVDRRERRLVMDFLVESGPASTHVLNAVSPAFTSAFPLARHVCDNHILT